MTKFVDERPDELQVICGDKNGSFICYVGPDTGGPWNIEMRDRVGA